MRALRYGDDEHYDVVSAFIKSIRGLGRRRRPLLARPHARGGRGRALHRPPAGDPRVARTSAWPTRMALPLADRGRARGRVRRAARGAAQPRARGRLPGQRAEVERRHGRARRGAGRRPGPAGRRGADAICGTRTTRARRTLGTARATSILTTRPEGWVPQEYRPAEVAGAGLLAARAATAPTSTADPAPADAATDDEESTMSVG